MFVVNSFLQKATKDYTKYFKACEYDNINHRKKLYER